MRRSCECDWRLDGVFDTDSHIYSGSGLNTTTAAYGIKCGAKYILGSSF